MSDSCEVPEFYEETYPRARKVHRCCECHGAIRPGEVYAKCVGKWDGTLDAYEQHRACRDFAAAVNRTWSGECFIAFGDLGRSIANASEWAEPEDVSALQRIWQAVRARGRGEAVSAA